jgi:hypothetical protein
MFITNASNYYGNPQFRLKMALIVLAGINMLVFEATAGRTVHRWDKDRVPLSGKIAGVLSLVFWITIIFLGRWVGFTTGKVIPTDIDIDLDKLF